jgi:hypothetical protein
MRPPPALRNPSAQERCDIHSASVGRRQVSPVAHGGDVASELRAREGFAPERHRLDEVLHLVRIAVVRLREVHQFFREVPIETAA